MARAQVKKSTTNVRFGSFSKVIGQGRALETETPTEMMSGSSSHMGCSSSPSPNHFRKPLRHHVIYFFLSDTTLFFLLMACIFCTVDFFLHQPGPFWGLLCWIQFGNRGRWWQQPFGRRLVSLVVEVRGLGMTIPSSATVDIYRSVDWFVLFCAEMIDHVINVQILDSPVAKVGWWQCHEYRKSHNN